jgi:spermidine synthase
VAFFVSGAAALAFETLWFRQAGLAFGNSISASSLVLSGFMLGMALGNLIAGRVGDRIAQPLRAYALLELIVAAGGVALVWGLPQLGRVLAPLSATFEAQPAVLGALRLSLAFALLLVPSAALGMTLPLMVRELAARDPSFGRALGVLYGVNTLGAVLGAIATTALLLPQFGITGSALLAAGLEACVAGAVYWLARGASAATVPVVSATPAWRGAPLLAAAFLAGFALLALEVIWLRLLTLFLNDTPLALALVLAVVLSGIALGGLVASVFAARTERADEYAALVATAAGVFGLLSYRFYPLFLQRYFRADQEADTILALTLPLVLPTALASGGLFTLLGVGLRRIVPSDTAATGRLTVANTLGAGLGPLLAGFVLLPWLGMERCLFALFASYGVVALLLWRGASPRQRVLRYAGGAILGLALLAFPFGAMRSLYVSGSASRWMGPGDQLLEVREGQAATHEHILHRLHAHARFDQLASNAYSMSVNDFAARRYMKLFVALPLALHPNVKRALVVGYGIGNTAKALTDSRELQRIDVADISADVLALGRRLRVRTGACPLDDPRVHVHIEDGRQYLEATSQRYDLITGEPPPPIVAGVENLYSREYFELVHSRLAPGGFATHWLPLMNISAATSKAVIHAFCDAFDDCSLWHASARNFMLMGSRAAGSAPSEEHFARQFNDPATSPELAAIGFELPAQLGALFVGDAPYLEPLVQDQPALTDDWPDRMHQPGSKEERDALIWTWRDTKATRARFTDSKWIARLWPPEQRSAALRQFENQRLINDLLFPEATPARQTQVLHQVLFGTRLQFPVLLLLRSDPDVQRVLASLPPNELEQTVWLRHRFAGRIAARDFRGSVAFLQHIPDRELAMPDLRDYVVTAIEHMHQ